MTLTLTETLANELMKQILECQHNIFGWQFKFDSAKRRFGQCNYRTKTISLSSVIVALNDEPEIKDTILHEIAHVLAGSIHGHDYYWKRVARSIGCSASTVVSIDHVNIPKGKYAATCKTCNNTVYKYKEPRSTTKSACAICCRKYNYGRFSEKYLLEFKKVA